MHLQRLRSKAVFLLAAGLLTGAALIGTVVSASADPPPDRKVTLCHAAGRDGTTKYVTLTISKNAVYKEQGGHFYENGTPRAGHEEDYFGSCKTGASTATPPKIFHTPEIISPEIIERPTPPAQPASPAQPLPVEPAFTG